jgi:hypothetical protein
MNVVVGVMAIVALFAPAHVQTSEWSSSVMAMTWMWYIYEWDSWFSFLDPYMTLQLLMFTFLRPVFLAMFYRMYKEKSTKKRVLIVGFLSESIIELFYYSMTIFFMLMSPWGWYSISWIFPIPLLFGIGLLYMKLVPPPEVSSWVDESEPSHWWTKDEEEKPKEERKEEPKEVLKAKPEEKPKVESEEKLDEASEEEEE